MNQSDVIPLLANCKEGDARAITQFVEVYLPHVFRMALSILDDPAEADEAAQDVLLRALNSLQSYRQEGKFTTWLYAITLNVCRGRLRKRRGRERLMQTLHSVFRIGSAEDLQPEEMAVHNESDAEIWGAIQRLPETQRLTITLRYYHSLPIHEIAQILGVSERAIHARLRKAHDRLRESLRRRVAEK